MKDLFSDQSGQYARYRPHYPDQLFHYLMSIVKNHGRLWDCATGNGQIAGAMSRLFNEVYATDISAEQLQNAIQSDNIFYSMQPAEHTVFADHFFDIVTVAQAIHWFDFEAFYSEVYRTLKPGGIIAVIGYGLCSIDGDENASNLIRHFYNNVVGAYWEPERKWVDENYSTIPFPFEELNPPAFNIIQHWNLQECLGYLSTWSAVKKYISVNKLNPLTDLEKILLSSWKVNITKPVRFSLLLRTGRLRP